MVHPLCPPPSNRPPRTPDEQRHYDAGYAVGEYNGLWSGAVNATVITALFFAAIASAFSIGRWVS